MMRLLRLLLPLAVVALALSPAALADEAAPEKAEETPQIASDEVAAEAVALFKSEYKARGLSGDDKLLQRDYAMSELARVQHPTVVKALAKISKSGNETLRTLAVIYLGEQTEMPGLAAPPILKAMKKGKKDTVLQISGLQSLGSLRYLGAYEEVGKLLNHRDFAVKKAAIQSIGQTGEMRLWKEVLKLAGVEVKSGDEVAEGTEQGGKEEVVEEGYSYEGVDVTYDTGTAGDGDQKMAEKIGKAKLAANKAAAQKSGGRGGGGGSAGSGATARGGVSRNPKELIPFVLHTLWKLTGEKFETSREVAKWVVENRQTIKDRIEVLDALEKSQKEDAKALK